MIARWALFCALCVLGMGHAIHRHHRTDDPEDVRSEIHLLQRRREALQEKMETLTRQRHVHRQKVYREPEAVESREALQQAQKAYRALLGRKAEDDSAQVAARQAMEEARQSYEARVESMLAADPEYAERVETLKKYEAERRRIQALLDLYREQKRP